MALGSAPRLQGCSQRCVGRQHVSLARSHATEGSWPGLTWRRDFAWSQEGLSVRSVEGRRADAGDAGRFQVACRSLVCTCTLFMRVAFEHLCLHDPLLRVNAAALGCRDGVGMDCVRFYAPAAIPPCGANTACSTMCPLGLSMSDRGHG